MNNDNKNKRINQIILNATEIHSSSVKELEDVNLTWGKIFRNTRRDLKLLISSLNTSYYLLGNNTKQFTEKNSELNYKSYRSLGEILHAAKVALIPDFERDPRAKEFIVGNYQEKKDEVWFFVNGIATSKGVAKINAKELSKVFETNIHVLYNPSLSIALDLVESIKERTYNLPTLITQSVYNVVKDTLLEGKKIKLLGHSQGGIITSSVINKLVKDKEMQPYLKNIELYTFASAAVGVKAHPEESEKAGCPIPYNEHFVNKKDMVAKLGAGSKELRKFFSGEVFELDEEGHLLNAHYLGHFRKGKYDPEKKSKLKKFYNKIK